VTASPLVRLVTCAHLPELAPDDRQLLAALRRLGVPVDVAVWDDPDVDWSSAPLTVIRSVFDYHLRRAEFLAWLDRVESRTRVENSPEIIRWNSHKSYLERFRDDGFPILETAWLASGNSIDLAEVMRRRGWTEAVVKPAVSASAHDTLKVTDSNAAQAQAHAESVVRRGDALVQPYLYDFETTGETSVIWLGGVQTHCARRPSGLHTTLEEAHVGKPLTPSRAELDLAHAVYGAVVPEPLYARIDLIDSRDHGLLVLELELIEPALYLRHSREVADQFARSVRRCLHET
jgi:hypothetical protein